MYKAIVSKITVRPLPGADRLQIGLCGQYQVIVGIDVKDGDLGVFFECDGQLSPEFCEKNDLIRRTCVETGKKVGGMFEANRRVKSIKLRGVRSDGFWTPLSKFEYTGVSSLKEGLEFTELNGHPICNKYVTLATAFSIDKKSNKTKKGNWLFKEHIETGQFKREFGKVSVGSVVYITEKLHGTSFRYGRLPANGEWIDRVLAYFGLRRDRWVYLVGSRRVELPSATNFRFESVKGIQLYKGECLYGELVGYEDTGKAIMGVDYTYGCMVGQCKMFVYRITKVDTDGKVVEYSHEQVVSRCRELGLTTVPLLEVIVVSDHDELCKVVKNHTENSDDTPLVSTVDGKTLREGVVVRFCDGWLKNKSFAFGVAEGYLKDTGVVDMEEAN